MEADATYIRRALDGDQNAFKQIMTKYHGPIFAMVYRMVHIREEAEDLVQETFIKAFNSLNSFNEAYAFSTWLYKIAVNNCIDYFRKKRLRTFPLENPIQAKEGEIKRDFPDIETTPENRMISDEKTSKIENAINRLPEKYRIAIELRHKDDKSYEEIADILKIPLGTVKARIFRAREMLKKELKDLLKT